MLQAGSTNVGSHLPAPRYPKRAVGYLFTPPCCPPRHHGEQTPAHGDQRYKYATNILPLKRVQHLRVRRVLQGMARAKRAGFAPQHPSFCLPIQLAGLLAPAFLWCQGQLGAGWASSQALGTPWLRSAPPKSEQQSTPVSQTAPLCSSHVTIEGICF